MESIYQNEVQLRVPGYFGKNNRRLGAGITIEREIFGPEYDNLEKVEEFILSEDGNPEGVYFKESIGTIGHPS